MQNQAAISVAGQKGLTIERKINLMLENGYNVFILRWKKVHKFRTSYFGFELMDFIIRGNVETGATYKAVIQREELFFEPDEFYVPVGYCPDTPRNREILASNFYTSHYVIAGLITPTGTINAAAVQGQIRTLADERGFKAPPRTRVVGVYGQTVQVGHENDAKELMKEKPLDPKQSVFGSKEVLEQVIAGQAPVPEPVKKLTLEECRAESEKAIHEQYRTLVEKLKHEKGKYWQSSKYYKEVVLVDINNLFYKLAAANGLEMPKDEPEKKVEEPEKQAEPEKVK